LPHVPVANVQPSDFIGDIFKTSPSKMNSKFPIEPVRIATGTALMVHAPGEMTFDIPPDSRSVSGQFGFAAGAYTEGGQTDGAEFSISWVGSNSTIRLFARYLDPAKKEQDRGLYSFNVDLSKFGPGKLILRTEPGSNSDWDWTVWNDIEIK
jgi:hypothetical protein